jgi:[acyl-carrier-protein] S-malonyltransferase
VKSRNGKVKSNAKVAFVFPGQGSQYVGMGKELRAQFTVAQRVFAEADETLGFSLSQICFSGPDSELKLTENTQPAILTVSVAALRVLESETVLRPDFVAGHSLGEYTALVCTGALSFQEAVKVVHQRGRLMQEAVPPGVGSMAVILGLGADVVRSLCERASNGEVVAPANYNGGGQIVIAGSKTAVARVMSRAKELGAKRVLDLPVSAPFHCPLMRPAAEGLEKVLDGVTVRSFSVGVVTNVEADVNLDPGRVKSLLIQQAVQPVRWEESVRKLESLGCLRVWEIGPGKVLKGLISRISPVLQADSFEAPHDLGRLAKEPA